MGYEQIKDIYEKTSIPVVLIGVPGLENMLSRYPQLYSRIGFILSFGTINRDEMESIIRKKCTDLCLPFNPQNATDREAMVDITRITRGNFSLLDRILQQIDRVVEINKLQHISKEVIRVARETLIIGVE